MAADHERGDDRHDVVVVPHRPGPLVALDRVRPPRERDDLDDLIDELVPDIDEGPGPFDLALVATGGGLLAWAVVGTAPSIVPAGGVAALGLGLILPLRTAWQRLRRRGDGRRQAALLDSGVRLVVSSAGVAALVDSYTELVDLAERITPSIATPALAAAHGALAEVATLLGGRVPASEREIVYVRTRTNAVAELVATLRPPTHAEGGVSDEAEHRSDVGTDAVLSAREELDEITASSSVARLDELTAELRDRRHGRP